MGMEQAPAVVAQLPPSKAQAPAAPAPLPPSQSPVAPAPAAAAQLSQSQAQASAIAAQLPSGKSRRDAPLRQCTSWLISGEAARLQIHHTDDSVSSYKAGGVPLLGVMVAQTSGSAWPVDLYTASSTLPVYALYDPGRHGPIKNPCRNKHHSTESPRTKSSNS